MVDIFCGEAQRMRTYCSIEQVAIEMSLTEIKV